MYLKACLYLILAIFCVTSAENTEEKLIEFINDVQQDQSINLIGGLSIERIKNWKAPRNIKEMNVLECLEDYINSHELKFTLPSDEVQVRNGRSQNVEESRSKRLRKMLLPILLGLKIKASLILSIAVLVIKMISLKGLALGFLALLFSGASFFKEAIAKKQDHVTTAYIAGAPLNTEILHTDWNRNDLASAHDLAYNYHSIP